MWTRFGPLRMAELDRRVNSYNYNELNYRTSSVGKPGEKRKTEGSVGIQEAGSTQFIATTRVIDIWAAFGDWRMHVRLEVATDCEQTDEPDTKSSSELLVPLPFLIGRACLCLWLGRALPFLVGRAGFGLRLPLLPGLVGRAALLPGLAARAGLRGALAPPRLVGRAGLGFALPGLAARPSSPRLVAGAGLRLRFPLIFPGLAARASLRLPSLLPRLVGGAALPRLIGSAAPEGICLCITGLTSGRHLGRSEPARAGRLGTHRAQGERDEQGSENEQVSVQLHGEMVGVCRKFARLYISFRYQARSDLARAHSMVARRHADTENSHCHRAVAHQLYPRRRTWPRSALCIAGERAQGTHTADPHQSPPRNDPAERGQGTFRSQILSGTRSIAHS